VTTVRLGQLVAETAGEGPAVILVHGLGGSSNTFQPLMETLSGHRVIRPDLPGSGRSPAPPGALSIESFVEALVGLAKALGVTSAHFVGHSLGTIVCQHLASAHPALVTSLTLFGALIEPAQATRDGLAARARTARAEGMEGIADTIVANTLSASTRAGNPAAVAFVRESLMRQDGEGYARTCEALAKATAADARLISVPTLIVAGSDDPVAPASVGQTLADRIRGAKAVVLDGCGHWMTIEKPAECARRLGEFVRTHDRG
jgi:3-oxoadipate enol-lactonase